MRNLLLAVVLAVAPVGAAAATRAPAVDAAFSCATPAGWDARPRADGTVFRGPRDESGIAALITVRYVAADNALYATPDAYMKRLTAKPDVAIPGWKAGTMQKTTVAGRAARRVVNDTSEFSASGTLRATEVPAREEHVAVPASKGFYVLVFYAPRALYERQRPVFAGVLESFKPRL